MITASHSYSQTGFARQTTIPSAQTQPGAGRMSLTMTKADGVTVLTLTSDPKSSCPPLCQILKGLCYSPACCSLSQRLRRVQRSSQSVLGALHIMVGLLNIGLGAILCAGASWWQIDESGFPFWLGGIFIMFGAIGILSEKYPSPCMVILNVSLNLLAGLAFTIAAIALYSINLSYLWVSFCDDYDDSYRRHNTPSPGEDMIKEKCKEGRALVLMLSRGINGLLIVLSVLELCLVISSAVLGIKALCNSERRENEVESAKLLRPESGIFFISSSVY
uniref:Transmembrane protein 176l.4 n=1 Tax=Sparus aurata TaxID=8175 RepID=A0A671W8P7_SPAAU